MWSRFLRALAALLNMYSFYRNPAKFILSILTIIIIPYLAYVFLGGLVFGVVIVLGVYLLSRWVTNSRARSA